MLTMVTCLTVSGRQIMIEFADKYITDCDLRFLPLKTQCIIGLFGKCHLEPEWRRGGVTLTQTNIINYLGVTLSHSKPH